MPRPGYPRLCLERLYPVERDAQDWAGQVFSSYCSSVTGSSQSVPPSLVVAGLMARWTMKESGDAPCQCRSPGGEVDYVSRVYLCDGTAFCCGAASSGDDVQDLALGMGVPVGAGFRLEADARDAGVR